MDKSEVIYQQRVLKITKYVTKRGNKYKIEVADGRLCRFWEDYFDNDEKAIESAKRELRSLYL